MTDHLHAAGGFRQCGDGLQMSFERLRFRLQIQMIADDQGIAGGSVDMDDVTDRRDIT